MFRDYFAETSHGRLARMRFVVLWPCLGVAFLFIGILFGLSVVVADHLVGGELAVAQVKLRSALALLAIIIGQAVLGLLFLFANLNILAKRARDIGLPGWITAIAVLLLSGGIAQYSDTSLQGGSILLLLVIVLALLPTDLMKR